MQLPSPLGRWCQPGLLLHQDWPVGDIFHCLEPTDWVPTPTCIPIVATATDGAHTWQGEG
eukprot:15097385-Ditylum_brightwellii.AAC.1